MSATVWHLSGIIYRHAKDWVEAGKCYKLAFKFDKTNQSILRELSNL